MLWKIIKIFLIFLILILFVNVLVINWFLFLREKPEEKSIAPVIIKKILEPTPTIINCPSQCVDLIREATSSTQIPTPKIVKETKYETVQTGSKEVIIPLGVGSTTSVNWIDLEGIETYIDSTNYPNYKGAYFEVSLKISSGNGKAFAQLYNVTDKHPVWYSEVSLEGSTPKMLISPKINLDNGNKLYRVQLKSSMGVQVNLDNARIRIVF